MTALLAILLQVGPPAPCAEPERLPYGKAAACTGGFLVPRLVVEGYVAASRVCAVRLDEAAQVADARVRACSEGVEVLHATLASVVSIFEAGQVEDVARLVEVEAPVCPWYRCPGWGGVVVGGIVAATGGAAVMWAVLR